MQPRCVSMSMLREKAHFVGEITPIPLTKAIEKNQPAENQLT